MVVKLKIHNSTFLNLLRKQNILYFIFNMINFLPIFQLRRVFCFLWSYQTIQPIFHILKAALIPFEATALRRIRLCRSRFARLDVEWGNRDSYNCLFSLSKILEEQPKYFYKILNFTLKIPESANFVAFSRYSEKFSNSSADGWKTSQNGISSIEFDIIF